MLTDLKQRSGLSYDVIGRRVHISKSTIHRYCRGESVPPDFATVERIAELCGATSAERARLYTGWSSAEASAPSSIESLTPVSAETPEVLPASVDEAARTRPVRAALRRQWLAWPRLRRAVAITAAATLALSAAGFWWPGSDTNAYANQALFGPSCDAPVTMGRTDGCVSEVQRLLGQAGATIEIDGGFGPMTMGKVTAFQTLAGLPATGKVDTATKKALYAGKVSLRSWPRDQVEARIRKVFTEAPDHAVHIAECRSHLDPHFSMPNLDGSLRSGVFQLSDAVVQELGGSRVLALDPTWNIQAAHQRFLASGDYGDRSCYEANPATPPPTKRPTINGQRAPPGALPDRHQLPHPS